MGGSILHLVAKGIEDMYMSSDPQITLFKIVYKRTTNFSMYDLIILPENGSAMSSSVSIPIKRAGDLLTKLFLVVDLPNILIKKTIATVEFVAKILYENGIIWNYSPLFSTDIVNLNIYNDTLVNIINQSLVDTLTLYNFFSNGIIMSHDSDYITENTVSILNNLEDQTYVPDIKSQLYNGRNLFEYLMGNMLCQYSETLVTNYAVEIDGSYYPTPLSYLPRNDVYSNAINASGQSGIQLYMPNFKNYNFVAGLLMQALMYYVYDTLVYNANYNNVPDSGTNINDGFPSLPIFGDILQRQSVDESILIPFPVYNADDIRNIFYITFIYNLTRIQIVPSGNTQSFNPEINTLEEPNTLQISSDNLNILTPDNVPIDESVLFYHIIDPSVNNYVVLPNNIDENTSSYFNTQIFSSYPVFNKYTDLISVTLDNFTTTDSYKIYYKYMLDIQNTFNGKIHSPQQVQQIIAPSILNNISGNVRYNFAELTRIMSIINNATVEMTKHYIITFYKKYNLLDNEYVPTTGIPFIPIINSNNPKLNDYFITVLNDVVDISDSNGTPIKNYFNNSIQNEFDLFITNCQKQLRSKHYDAYTSQFQLWNRLLFSNGSNILDTYQTADPSAQVPPETTFGVISYMNYLPFLVVKDVAKLVYDVFNSYAETIFINIGADTSSSNITFNNFMESIDMRDQNDGSGITTSTVNQTTKNQMYQRIINNVFLANDTIADEEFMSELQITQANNPSINYLLSYSFKPSVFFPQYSTQEQNGDLIDVPSDILYLPTEWISQTYYQILQNIIVTFINELSISSDMQTEGISQLVGILGNVINCFIIREELPIYSSYQNNGSTLLGLVPSTSSIISQYLSVSFNNSNNDVYCDAISSIWYQSQKRFIQLYNGMFNNMLLSYKYYNNDLGSMMGNVYNYIANVFIGNSVSDPQILYPYNVQNSLNPYYSQSINPYVNRIPESILDSYSISYSSDITNIFQINSSNITSNLDVLNGSFTVNQLIEGTTSITVTDGYLVIPGYNMLTITGGTLQCNAITSVESDTDNIITITGGTLDTEGSQIIGDQINVINGSTIVIVTDTVIEPYITSYTISQIDGELYPPINTQNTSNGSNSCICNNSQTSKEGFDFYRLMGLGNSSTSDTGSYYINTYIKNFFAMWLFILTYYNTYKDITKIKNDTGSLLAQSNDQIISIDKKSFYYNKSGSISTDTVKNSIIDYLYEHTQIKYITQNKSINLAIKNKLTTLLSNTTTYWNPNSLVNDVYVRNPTGIYGILDILYNENLVGNLITTMKFLNNMQNLDNPFSSFCLHEWFRSLINTNYFLISDFQNIYNLFESFVFYNDLNSTAIPKITSENIIQNRQLEKLYSNDSGVIFPEASYVPWLVSDHIISSIKSFGDMLKTISKKTVKFNDTMFYNNTTEFYDTDTNTFTDGGAINTLQLLTSLYFVPIIELSVKKVEKITNFTSTTVTKQINNLYPFINVSEENNTDLYFYKPSSDGNPKIKVKLEIKILDLINTDPPKFSWVRELGHRVASEVNLTIGGQLIESYTPELFHLNHQIYQCTEQNRGYDILIGNTKEMYIPSSKQKPITRLYVPLYFWFSKHDDNALPLIGLLYSDVVINVIINNIDNLLIIPNDFAYLIKTPILKFSLMARYTYLEEDERKKMAESKLEYLIEKYNYNGLVVFSKDNFTISRLTGTPLVVTKIKINLQDPVKFFVWYIKIYNESTEFTIDNINWVQFGFNVRNFNGDVITINDIISTMSLQFNGTNRQISLDPNYYNYVVPYACGSATLNQAIFMYSFGLYPLILQPSGAVNLSEIAEAQITIILSNKISQLLINNPNLKVKTELWGLSYNTFRVFSGMGGLGFMKSIKSVL